MVGIFKNLFLEWLYDILTHPVYAKDITPENFPSITITFAAQY